MQRLSDNTYVFTEPKSERSRRTIALSPSAILMLRDYREKLEHRAGELGTTITDTDLIFSRLDGTPLRPNTVTRCWNQVSKKAGLKHIRLHDARHTHATLMLKQGIHPKIVQERLGHSSISMTLDTYSHVAPGLQEAAAQKFDTMVNPTSKKEAPEIIG
jgi:integrase